MFQVSRQAALFHAKRGVVRASALYQPRALGSQAVSHYLKGRAISTEQVPPEDYYDGHLLTDRLEYLDDMLDKTLALETSLDELKATYQQKKSAMKQGGSSSDMDSLFEKSAFQKENMSRQIEVLKASLKSARSGYAVDAPDGVSDFEINEGVQEAASIIDYAAKHEDKEAISKRREQEKAVRMEQARDPEHDW
jgi:hypothetical protein